jgi:hypothetical protein
VLILQEEMRRCLATLDHQRTSWISRANTSFDGERWEGASAYAHYQASVRKDIMDRFLTLWSGPVEQYRDFQPSTLDLRLICGDSEDDIPMGDEEDWNEEDEVEEEKEEQIEEADDQDEEEKEDEMFEDVEEERLEDEKASDEEQDAGEGDEDNVLTLKEIMSSLEEELMY